MNYIVSNVYGRHERFEKLLKKINFSDRDVMYILGNIVDYGEEAIELVNDISTRLNVYSVLGEHDYKAFVLLSEFSRILRTKTAPSVSFSNEMITWAREGGQSTLEAFKDADADAQEGFLDYLSDLPVFEETEVGGREYVLTCRGIGNFNPDKDLTEYGLDSFTDTDFDIDREYFKDKTLTVGYLDYEHTPTGLAGKVISRNNNLALACDMSESDDIVCMCLESGEIYYV